MRAVYFIQVGHDGPVKIGQTQGDARDRLIGIQVGCPYELRLLRAVEDATDGLEGELHERFARHRIRGEWFHPHAEVMEAASAQYETRAGRQARLAAESLQREADELREHRERMRARIDLNPIESRRLDLAVAAMRNLEKRSQDKPSASETPRRYGGFAF